MSFDEVENQPFYLKNSIEVHPYAKDNGQTPQGGVGEQSNYGSSMNHAAQMDQPLDPCKQPSIHY